MCDKKDADKFQVVQFRTKDFGMLDEGTIISAYLLNEENETGSALLYFPPDEDGSGCFIVAKRINATLYEDHPKDNFVNVSAMNSELKNVLPKESLPIKKTSKYKQDKILEVVKNIESDLSKLKSLCK